MLTESWVLPFKLLPKFSIEGSIIRGLREAIAIGAVRARVVGVDMA